MPAGQGFAVALALADAAVATPSRKSDGELVLYNNIMQGGMWITDTGPECKTIVNKVMQNIDLQSSGRCNSPAFLWVKKIWVYLTPDNSSQQNLPLTKFC